MTPAKPITEEMIDAVLGDYATNDEASLVYDAALTDEYLRKRLSLVTFAEEAEQYRQRDANALHLLATVVLGLIFLFAGVLWLDVNISNPTLLVIMSMVCATSAFWSAYVVVNCFTKRKKD